MLLINKSNRSVHQRPTGQKFQWTPVRVLVCGVVLFLVLVLSWPYPSSSSITKSPLRRTELRRAHYDALRWVKSVALTPILMCQPFAMCQPIVICRMLLCVLAFILCFIPCSCVVSWMPLDRKRPDVMNHFDQEIVLYKCVIHTRLEYRTVFVERLIIDVRASDRQVPGVGDALGWLGCINALVTLYMD